MTNIVVIDERDVQVTPFFRIMEIENIPKSETAGYPVMETHEMVEIRKAGDRHNILIAPADAFWKREAGMMYTYMDRWPEQYREFKEGNPQEAQGTPLETLKRFGITDEQVSLCRVMRIYSVEALHLLEGPGLRNLGTHQNKLKQAAATHMADRTSTISAMDEMAALRAEIAELKAAGSMIVPAVEAPVPDVEVLLGADSDDEVRNEIARLTGTRPHHKTSRANLEIMLKQARELAA